MKKRLLRSTAARRVLCRAIAAYVRLVWRTSRFRTVGGNVPAGFWESGQPFILAFWHGRLLMAPKAWRPGVAMNMLISGHADGQIIAGAIRHFGLKTVTGSKSRGGAGALRRMVRALAAGECVGVTPDGPRGPVCEVQPGIVAAARLAAVPILPLAFSTTRRHRLGSWDRFHLALPFSRGSFVWGEPVRVAAGADEANLEAARLLLEQRLRAVTAEADRLCGHGENPTR